MALLNIPISNFPDSTFTVELDKVVYSMRVVRNSRSERYALSLFTEDGDLILAGIPLVTNFPLLDRFKSADLPPGSLFLWDSTGKNREATEDTIGVEHLLLYEEFGT